MADEHVHVWVQLEMNTPVVEGTFWQCACGTLSLVDPATSSPDELTDDEAAAAGVMLAEYFERVGVKLPVLLFKDGTIGVADGRCRFGCEESVRRTGH